jgi:hypothetical protein
MLAAGSRYEATSRPLPTLGDAGDAATMSRVILVTARGIPPELSRGVVEHCVLALVDEEESYAFRP